MAKPVSPKKETARIILPSEAPKSTGPALPRATVKMQQTQPLSKSMPPASGVTTLVTTASSVSHAPAAPAKSDTLVLVFSILAFIGSLAALALAFFAYKAAEIPPWAR